MRSWCNRLWLLKNSLPGKSWKQNRVRMCYRRSLESPGHFLSPKFRQFFKEGDSFNSHVCFRKLSVTGRDEAGLFPWDHGSRVRQVLSATLRLSACPFTSFRQRVEVTTAGVQHTCAGQFIDRVEHALPFGCFVACRLEYHLELQPTLPH